MKKSSAFVLSILGLFAFSMLVASVSAADVVTLVNPASSATVGGSAYIWNVTNSTNFDQLVNCTLWGKSAGATANTTLVNVAFASNDSASAQLLMVNGTFNSLGFEDGNDYSFYASCYNLTNSLLNTSTNTNIIIDNGVPTAPVLSPSTNTQITATTTQTFTGTVVDRNTTACTYSIGRGGINTGSSDTTSGSAVYSGSSCTFTKTFSTSSDNGDWYWQMTASDGTNTTASGNNIFSVQIPAAGGGFVPAQQAASGKSLSVVNAQGNVTGFGWAIGIVIAIGVVIWLVKRK